MIVSFDPSLSALNCYLNDLLDAGVKIRESGQEAVENLYFFCGGQAREAGDSIKPGAQAPG
jgi:hypothetical protein